MSTLRKNNIGDATGLVNPITLTNGGTTCSWSSDPHLPIVAAPDILKIIVEPMSANAEVIYVLAYAGGGATTATSVTRLAEAVQGGAATAIAHSGKAWVSGPTASDIKLPTVAYMPWMERVYATVYGNSYSASWGNQQSAIGDNYVTRLARRHGWINTNSLLSFAANSTQTPIYGSATSGGATTLGPLLYYYPNEGAAFRSISGTMSTDIEMAAIGGAAGSPSAAGVGQVTTWVPQVFPGVVISDPPLNDLLMNVVGGTMNTKGKQGLWNSLSALYSIISAGAIVEDNDPSITYTGTWTSHSTTLPASSGIPAAAHGGAWSFTTTLNSKAAFKVPGAGAMTIMLLIPAPESGFSPTTQLSIQQNGAGVACSIGGTAYNAAAALAGISMVDQTVQGSMGATASGIRADPVSYASGTSTITDTQIRVSDLGTAFTGAGIPASSFVGTVIPGTSFTLSSSATKTIAVTTTAASSTGTGYGIFGAAPKHLAGHVPLILTGLNTAFTLDIVKLDANGSYVGIDCYVIPAPVAGAAPSAAQTITALTFAGTTCTATITSTAAMYVGQEVTMASCYGFDTNNPNGTSFVASIPSTTTFTFLTPLGVAPTGAYLASSGSATPQNPGCATIVQVLGVHIATRGFTKYYCPSAVNATIDDVNTTVVKPVAALYANVVVVDPNAGLAGLGTWDTTLHLGQDGIHPNQRGYDFLADLIDATLLSSTTWRQGQNNLTV